MVYGGSSSLKGPDLDFKSLSPSDWDLPVILLQRLTHWPAAREELARRLGKAAAKCSKSLESYLNFGTWVDEVVMVAAGTVGDRAEAHHGTRLEGSDEP